MYTYSLGQWVLLFFFYSFLGWIWECLYVSLRKGKWVNRGFMHGPMLPIYGFGAIVVLFLALPVRGNVILVFLFGMTGATVLEYFTGLFMEKLFHMRYWDYTGKPLNINGYICLFCSVGWGFFSVALVEFMHKPVERILLGFPDVFVEIVVLCSTIIAVVDFTQSFNAAMDLRDLLEKVTENNEKLRRLEKRVDVVTAVVDDDIRHLRQRSIRILKEVEDYIKNPRLFRKKRINIRLGRSISILKRNPTAISKEFADVLNQVKNVINKHRNKN